MRSGGQTCLRAGGKRSFGVNLATAVFRAVADDPLVHIQSDVIRRFRGAVISAAKLRVRPDCRQIPCWLRFTAAQATLQTHNYKLGVLTHRQLSKGASYTTTKIM